MRTTAILKICCIALCVCNALYGQDSPPRSTGDTDHHEPSSQPPERMRVSQNEMQKLLVRRVLPHYPQEAREKDVQGDVVLKLIISSEGNIRDVSLISGEPLLAPAAIGAVKLWKYRPFMSNGHAIEVETQTAFSFKLETPGDPGVVSAPGIEPAGGGGAGSVPGGIPSGPTGALIDGIINSAQTTMPRVAMPQRVRVSQGVSSALLLKKVNPEYPPEARRGRIQGTVLLHVIIGKDGDIATMELVSGHNMLAPAAMDAVKQWRYKPYLLNGNPVEVDTQIQVNFTLAGD